MTHFDSDAVDTELQSVTLQTAKRRSGDTKGLSHPYQTRPGTAAIMMHFFPTALFTFSRHKSLFPQTPPSFSPSHKILRLL